MKFLVDAQLPLALAEELRALGHNVRHTWELPRKNETPDSEVSRLADLESRIVFTVRLAEGRVVAFNSRENS